MAKGDEKPLDHIWQRITDPNTTSVESSRNGPGGQNEGVEGSLGQVELDCGVQLLSSGVSFSRDTYIGKGRLEQLLNPPLSDDGIPRPNPTMVFDLHITSYSAAHDFRGVLENLINKLVNYISSPTRSVPRDEYKEWQKAFLASSQHMTWFLAHSDQEEVTSLRLEADEHLRRISASVEEHHAVRDIEELASPPILRRSPRKMCWEIHRRAHPRPGK